MTLLVVVVIGIIMTVIIRRQRNIDKPGDVYNADNGALEEIEIVNGYICIKIQIIFIKSFHESVIFTTFLSH